MYQLLLLTAVLAVSYALTRVLVDCGERLQLIDVPNARSSHVKPTPRGGGAAIVVSSLMAIQVSAALGQVDWPLAMALSLGGGLVAAIGFWDDRASLSPAVRLLGQLGAACLLLFFLGVPHVPALASVPTWAALLLPAAAVLGVTWMINLTNFMDGIDGLAAAECVFVLLARVAFFPHENSALVIACLTIAAAGLGFLLLNWSPASIFMGDAGSGFLGLVSGALLLADVLHAPARVWVWLVLLSAFLADSGVTLTRRLVAGKKVWQAHRSHAYQHAAGRWGHARTTTAFVAVNVCWLTPLAVLAGRVPHLGFALFVVGITPLVFAAYLLGAGVDDGRIKHISGASMSERLMNGVLQNRALHLGAKYLIQAPPLAGAVICAFGLGFDVPSFRLAAAVVAWTAVHLATIHLAGGMGAWRYFSTHDLLQLVGAHLSASLLVASLLVALRPGHVPLALLAIEFTLAVAFSIGLRTLTRLSYELLTRSKATERKRTLIYGAGAAGVLLLQEARRNTMFRHSICGFVDDQKHKGLSVQGVRVLGKGADLKRLVQEHNIAEVLIAIPSAKREDMARIAESCRAIGVAFHTMPAISEMLSHCSMTKQIRDVNIEDVLGRNPVHLANDKISSKLQGRVALVTGAAGSIGSELCRQIARFGPAKLVAFDLSETATFFLEREMQQKFPGLVFCPEIGSIQNAQRLRDVFGYHRPNVVFHAAAFKHVPLMERHMFEAVENNVFGTYNLATAAAEFQVEDFVMISTDKAVRPTNVMGATKRAAEMLIRSMQSGGPRYVSVRFGNVLGSNGSVLPIFKQQVASGGPVTVTHPDIERFFMTIPEAAQLVLQACTMGSGGEIFVLEMGKPVKIVDLARQFIWLSGFEPDRDIRIEFTGLRPGEKMYEELNLESECTLATEHEKIKVFSGHGFSAEQAYRHLERLGKACRERDADLLIRELKSMIPDYCESRQVQEQQAFTASLISLSRGLDASGVRRGHGVGIQREAGVR